MAQEKNLPFVVGFVFSTAAGKAGIDKTAVPTAVLLKCATGEVERWLGEGKGAEITDVGWEEEKEDEFSD